MKVLTIKIFGRVQGVGFRYAAQKEAHKLGITGFARNEPDGSVYIEVQGEGDREDDDGKDDRLKKFLAWCHKGPWLAKVERVESSERESESDSDTAFTEFSIQ